MACCGLCRPKVKSPVQPKKNITTKKIHTIDMWIENIEGPYESIQLSSKSPPKPKKITNKEEILEAKIDDNMTETSLSSEQSTISVDENGRENL